MVGIAPLSLAFVELLAEEIPGRTAVLLSPGLLSAPPSPGSEAWGVKGCVPDSGAGEASSKCFCLSSFEGSFCL